MGQLPQGASICLLLLLLLLGENEGLQEGPPPVEKGAIGDRCGLFYACTCVVMRVLMNT